MGQISFTTINIDTGLRFCHHVAKKQLQFDETIKMSKHTPHILCALSETRQFDITAYMHLQIWIG
jgi:hypothetical protein